MSAVYEIWNQQLEIYRAVKIIYAGFADLFQSRFQTEIKISAKLKHPNIIEIHGVGEWNGLPFIEMEKIDGIGLDQVLAQQGALPGIACMSVAIMICKKIHISKILDKMAWNITRAADSLGIDRVTLYSKISKYGLKKP